MKKSKINTTKKQEGLQNPFETLSSSNLPPPPPNVNLEKEPPPAKTQNKSKGRVVLRRETAHRGGKTVIVVTDFPDEISEQEIEILGRDLRKYCSCGGAVKERKIEIQGKQIPKIREFLTNEGFNVAGER